VEAARCGGSQNGGSQKWREPEIEGAKTGGESREKCSENNRAAKTDNNQEGSHKKGTEQQHSRWMIFDQSSSGPDMSGRSSGVVFDSRGSNVVADTGFQGKVASLLYLIPLERWNVEHSCHFWRYGRSTIVDHIIFFRI